MPVCEQCGSSFKTTDLPAELSTARLLCRPCYDRRQAEKAGKASTKAASGALATKAAPPVTRTAPPTPAPTSHAPVNRTLKTNDDAPRKAADAPGNHSGNSSGNSGAGEAAHAAHSADAKNAARASSRHSPKREEKPAADALREKQVLDHTTKIGLLVALAFVLVAGGVFVFSKSSHDKEVAAVEKGKRDRSDFLASLEAINLGVTEEASRAIGFIDAKSDVWRGSDIAVKVEVLRQKAEKTIEDTRSKQDFLNQLANFEAQAKNAETMPVEDVRNLRRSVEALALHMLEFGNDAVQRVTQLRAALDSKLATRLVDDARDVAAKSSGDPRAALLKLAEDEDEVRRMWEKAYSAKNQETMTLFESYLEKVIKISDDVATAFFTPTEVERVPWSDLLVGDAASDWKATVMPGFKFEVANGTITMTGPDEKAKAKPVVISGDKHHWRDFVIDVEFVVDSGAVNFFFRLAGGSPSNNSDHFEVRPEIPPFEAGKPYGFTYTMIGSKVTREWKDGISPKSDFDLDYKMFRQGPFAIVASPGTKIRLTKVRVRILR